MAETIASERAGADARTAPRSRAVWWCTAGVALAHLVLAAFVVAPTIQPDEAGYLGTAHWFAFGHGLISSAAPYSPLLGLLLAPISRVTGDPLTTFRLALVVDALLLAGVVPLGDALARRVVGPGERERTRALVAAVLVALSGGYLLVGAFVLASSLLVFGSFLVALLVVWAWEHDAFWRWLLAGAVAAALVGAHPVGVVVAAATVLAPWFGTRRSTSGRNLRRFGAVLVGVVPVVVGARLLVDATRHATTVARHVGARGSASGGAQSRVGYTFGQIRDALGFHNLHGLLAEAAGQLLYLTAATFGLFLLGMVVAGRAAPRALRDPTNPVGVCLAAYAGLVMLGGFLASVLVINPAADVPGAALLYGRYNEQVAGVVLLLGVLGLPRVALTTRRVGLAIAGVAAVAVGCTVTVLVAWPGAADLRIDELSNLLGVFAPVNALERLGVFRFEWMLPILAVMGIVGFAVLLVAQKLGGTRVLAVVAGAAFVVPAAAAGVVLARASEGRANERTLVVVIEHELPHGGCVGYRAGVESSWWLANYEFLLPDVQFRPVTDATSGDDACAGLVLAFPDDPAVAAQGLVPVATERVPDPFPITLYRHRSS